MIIIPLAIQEILQTKIYRYNLVMPWKYKFTIVIKKEEYAFKPWPIFVKFLWKKWKTLNVITKFQSYFSLKDTIYA